MAYQLAQPELSRWESTIHTYRVHELQAILQQFKQNKLGKKQELIVRVIQILRTPQQQQELVKYLTNLNSSSRGMNQRSHPYQQPNQLQNRGYNSGYGANNIMPHQMYGNGGAVMGMYNTNSNPRPVRGLRCVNLPFYDPVTTILEPIELMSVPSGLKTQQKVQFTFSIPQQYHSYLTYRETARALPRHELQLRFFHLPNNFHQTDQPDDFPPNCNVKIDDCLIVLPNIIPTNKPNVEAKRPSRPVNITMNCQPVRDSTMGRAPHKLVVDWTGDRRAWAVGIFVVIRVTADILRDRAQANEMFRQDAAVTKQQIIRRMTVGDDDGIKMDQVRISLLCPLGKTRMGLPARCRDCTHLQCFDLDLFLKMNEKRPTWKCGICNGIAPYNRLLIDGYFQDILRDVTDVNEVELLTDGGYKRIQEEINELSDSDDDADTPRPSNCRTSDTKPAATVKQQPADDDIITLDSDDDDDLQLGIAASVTNNQSISTPPRKSQDIEVIDLDDDTPPRPAKVPEPQDQNQGPAASKPNPPQFVPPGPDFPNLRPPPLPFIGQQMPGYSDGNYPEYQPPRQIQMTRYQPYNPPVQPTLAEMTLQALQAIQNGERTFPPYHDLAAPLRHPNFQRPS